jgi:hypothetical protein
MLGVSKAAAIIPALSRLQGAWHYALKFIAAAAITAMQTCRFLHFISIFLSLSSFHFDILAGQYAEAVAALKTLQDTLVPGQRLRSPTAIMRAVLGEVKSQSKRASTTEPLQQLSRLLAVPAAEVVSTATR